MPQVSQEIHKFLTGKPLSELESYELATSLGLSATSISDLDALYALTGLTGGERYKLPDGTIMRYRGAYKQAIVINTATGASSNDGNLSGSYSQAGDGNFVDITKPTYEIVRNATHFVIHSSQGNDAFYALHNGSYDPTTIPTWTMGIGGSGVLLQSELSKSYEAEVSNWINETTNTITTPTDESKLSLAEISKGVQVEVSHEANRIEQYLGDVTNNKYVAFSISGTHTGVSYPIDTVNSFYTIEYNSKPQWGFDGGAPPAVAGIRHDGTRWEVRDNNATIYVAVEDVDFPWEVTTWTPQGGEPADYQTTKQPVATEANWNTRHSPQQLITEHVIVPDVVDLTNGYYDFDFAALFPHVDLKKASIEITAIVHINTSASGYGARVMMDMVSDAGLALANRSTGTIGYEGDDLTILGNYDSSAMFMHFKVPHGSLRSSTLGVKQNYIHADWWVTGEDIPIGYNFGYVNDPALHFAYMLDYAASGNAAHNQNETLMWHRAAFSPMTVDPTRYRLSTDSATAILNIRDARVTISYPA